MEAASLTPGSVLRHAAVSVTQRGDVLTSRLMDTVAWTIIGVGTAPLVAVGAAWRSVHEERCPQGGRIDAPGEDLRERVARFEGLRDVVACMRVG